MTGTRQDAFPYRSLAALAVCLLAQGLAVQQIFSYAGFLIVHFDLGTRDTAGYYAGYLGGMFMLGRMVASYPLGILADKWGRKPVVYISCASLAIGSLGFGLSPNYPCALASRLVLGLFNGVVAVSKTVVSEICHNPVHETQGMAVITTSWYTSMLMAPAIGGVLYGHGVWGTERVFPQLLPNLVTVVAIVIGGVCTFKYLPETLCKEGPRGGEEDSKEEAQQLASQQRRERVGLLQPRGEDDDGGGEAKGGASPKSPRRRRLRWARTPGSRQRLYDEEGGSDDDGSRGFSEHDVEALGRNRDEEQGEETAAQKGGEQAGDGGRTGGCEPNAKPHTVEEGEGQGASSPPLLTRRLVVTLFLYCLYSLASICLDEVVSLWAIASPEKGGLGWDANQLGGAISLVALFTLLFSVFVYSPVTNLLGRDKAFTVFAFVGAPGALLLPLVAAWAQAHSPSLLFPLVVLTLFATRASGSVCFACIALMVNHSVVTANRGRANGLSMTVGSLAKALGPALAAPVFAWSINEVSVPWLVFSLAGGMMLLCGLGGMSLQWCSGGTVAKAGQVSRPPRSRVAV